MAAAHAQSTGIAVDRFSPAPGPLSFAQVEGASVPVAGQLWFAGGASFIGRPLVLRNAVTQQEVAVPVRYRLTVDVGAELGIYRKRLSVGFAAPISIWQAGDRLRLTGTSMQDAQGVSEPLGTTGLGDLRFRGKALLTPVDHKAGLAIVLELTAPGGGQRDFIATSSFTVSPRLLGSFRHRFLAFGGQLGVRFASQRPLYQTLLHNQLEWGAAFAGKLPVRRVGLALIAEAAGQVNLVSGSSVQGTELRGIVRLGWLRGAIDLGGGAGIGELAPAFRGFVVVRGHLPDPKATSCPAEALTF